MAVFINVDGSTPSSRKTFQIEGDEYVFHTYWNYRAGGLLPDDEQNGAWQIGLWLNDFPDSEDDYTNLIIGGRQVMIGQDLFGSYGLSGVFKGKVFCVDTSPITGDNFITMDNFGEGRRYQLLYFSPEELVNAGVSL